jgi:tetratricopeptide (TPR) repeat protein
MGRSWVVVGILLLGAAMGDEMTRFAEDAARFDAQLKAEPANVDAAYNAAQAYYNLGKMGLALERWRHAQKLAPDDFDIAKKVLQATYGAGHAAEIPAAHAAVLALWKKSSDARVRGLKEFVFDQFHLGQTLVMANETLAPSGDLYDVYNFKLYDSANKLVGIVHLESSQYGRETGVPFVVGVTTPARHLTKNIMFKSLPPYAELKQIVAKVAAGDLGIK